MSEKIKVLINGAKGKMGAESVKAVEGATDMIVVGETDVGDDLEQEIKKHQPEVVVDFTAPTCAMQNAEIIARSNAGGVIGTTGFTPEQIKKLQEQCSEKKPGIIIAPNFAIGALLMMHCSKIIAKYMPEVEIIELHHPGKKDAPSGTAIKTAEMIAEERNENVPRGTFEGGARGELFSNIPVHSVRLPGFLAHQEVIFGCEGQTLSLRHDSINRSCFMPGVLLGIREVMKINGLVYGLDKILFGK